MKVLENKQVIRRKLLSWYDKHARILPWRETKDPYAIWISEIMLQQTQVQTVIPYYNRFLARFPSVQKLSRARLDTVLKYWEGLGYYSRAKNLHKAAKIIVREYKGQFPETVKELLLLPGIGRYTASAIASIAFNQKAAVLDGNVTRVLCRLFRIKAIVNSTKIKHTLWDLAEALVSAKRPGCFNQAVMELGAILCRPVHPQCTQCPLKNLCLARLNNEQEKLPRTEPSKKVPQKDSIVAVIQKDGYVFMQKRKSSGLLPNLWEFPTVDTRIHNRLPEKLNTHLADQYGITLESVEKIATVKHTYSHFVSHLKVYCCRIAEDLEINNKKTVRWIAVKNLNRYAVSRAYRKIIDILKKKGKL